MLILQNKAIDRTNVDDAIINNLIAGYETGIVKGYNDFKITKASSNVISIDTGILMMFGCPIKNTVVESIIFNNFPSTTQQYKLVAELKLENSVYSFQILYFDFNQVLVKEELYKTEGGVYQFELANFILSPNGIQELTQTVDILLGKDVQGSSVNIGTVTTVDLPQGSKAYVDIENKLDELTSKIVTNFTFGIPQEGITYLEFETEINKKLNKILTEEEKQSLLSQLGLVVDQSLNVNSLNAIANKAVTEKFNELINDLLNKVDKVSGKELSSNDFTDALLAKLNGIAAEANKTVISTTLSTSTTTAASSSIVNTVNTQSKSGVAGQGEGVTALSLGTTNNYKKEASGVLECWGYYTYSGTADVYYDVDFLHAFSQLPVVTVNKGDRDTRTYRPSGYYAVPNVLTTTGFTIASGDVAGNKTFYWHAKGRWK